MILARAGQALPQTADDADGQRWLVLADRGAVGERVEAALVRDGHRVMLVRRDAECGGSAADDHARPTRTSGWSELLEAAGPIHGVVHLWALDAPTESGAQDPKH